MCTRIHGTPLSLSYLYGAHLPNVLWFFEEFYVCKKKCTRATEKRNVNSLSLEVEEKVRDDFSNGEVYGCGL